MRDFDTTLPIEPAKWHVVFHRKAESWIFAAIACGEFKHVSAFAWLPELSIWIFYDVGFRRTRLFAMADGPAAQDQIGLRAQGNAIVTVDVRTDALPWMRAGLFCTTAVKHLIGLRSSALRPDRLFRHLIATGGILRDAGRYPETARRSDARCRAAAGAERADQGAAGSVTA